MPPPAVRIAYEPKADVWHIHTGDMEGLSAEAPTANALIARLPTMITDLRNEDEPVPVEITIV